jgi:RNA polymerase subunit RPABC4/transcription elongation factor Spt4
MSLWDDISRKVTKGTKVVSQKSGELIEVTKIRLDMASEKDKIRKLYEDIGKAVYSSRKDGVRRESEIEANCQLIDEIQYKIRRLNQKIVQIKGGSLCKRCGQVVGPDQRYCHSCGRELELTGRVVADNDDYRVELSNGEVCKQCGALNQDGSEYCASCGKRLNML